MCTSLDGLILNLHYITFNINTNKNLSYHKED